MAKKKKKGKLDPLRRHLLAAFIKTSLLSPPTAASGATPPSTAASDVGATSPSTAASDVEATSPFTAASDVEATSPSDAASDVGATSPSDAASDGANVRPTDGEVKELAKLVLEKRLTKCRGPRADALANGRGALDVTTAILMKVFARFTPSCAKIIFKEAMSDVPIMTLKGKLFLTGEAAARAVAAFTEGKVGVYYYEAPFQNPGDDLVKKYELMGKHNGDGRGSRRGFVHNPPPPDYGKKFIDKCVDVWDQGTESVQNRYVGKKESVTGALIERGVAHFNPGSDSSGAKLFYPAASRVPGLMTGGDPSVAESITAAAFLDWYDIGELVEELKWTEGGVCWFSEAVMQATVRTRCFDEDGGFGTNVTDGFADWDPNERTSSGASSSGRTGSSCTHGKLWQNCAACNPCPHGKVKRNCTKCNSCPHGRVKRHCADCNPCPHGKLKRDCADCNPCPHGQLKQNCAACNACPHGKLKRNCTKCNSCPHGKRKDSCDDCNPCPHGKLKQHCSELECSGCAHGKVKRNCADCNPCPHGKRKHHCVDCNPCPHGKLKQHCSELECSGCAHGALAGKCTKCKVLGKRKHGNAT